MVASGGPYAIEHPAPGWVWVMPLSIVVGMACFFLNLFTSQDDGVNLMPLAWPALFLSLGWNFLEFAFAPPGGGLAWGWLVCGVVFVLMGGLPLLFAFKSLREKVRSRSQGDQGLKPYAGQWLLIGAGVYLGIVFFRSVAG
jgi:Na+/melibiose symporter-like transporter